MPHEPKLGQLLDQHAQRDAVHIAIAPMVAGEPLNPGEHIGLMDPEDQRIAGSVAEPIGIVDPFLKKPLEVGDSFYMFLYPQTITSLRHNWTHPAFNDVTITRKAASSEQWLRHWFETNDAPTYEDFMKAVRNRGQYVDTNDSYYSITIYEDYVSVGGWDAHADIPDELWDHVETVIGEKLRNRPTHFSCSC